MSHPRPLPLEAPDILDPQYLREKAIPPQNPHPKLPHPLSRYFMPTSLNLPRRAKGLLLLRAHLAEIPVYVQSFKTGLEAPRLVGGIAGHQRLDHLLFFADLRRSLVFLEPVELPVTERY